MKEKIIQIIIEVSDQHPYKKAGDRETYSSYNEGWSDACDVIEQRLIEEIVHPEPECQFESDTSTSSATICKHCGKEKHEHNFVDRVEAGTIRSKTTYAKYKDFLSMYEQPPSNQ
jgi:hypothetical protein